MNSIHLEHYLVGLINTAYILQLLLLASIFKRITDLQNYHEMLAKTYYTLAFIVYTSTIYQIRSVVHIH